MRAKSLIRVTLIGFLCFTIWGLAQPVGVSALDSAPPEKVTNAALSWDATTPITRYGGISDWLVESGARTPAEAYGPFPGRAYKVGDTETFFALDYNSSSNTPRRLTATLKQITDHAYWWFEKGTVADPTALVGAGKQFETQIYPLDHKLFGTEWSPGIDGDPHIFLLHQKTIGGGAVGVFSSRDECARSICPTSNQHELLYIGLDFGPVGSPQEMTVIAHEFQHLIQYHNTGGQDRWLDEGFAQLAEHLNGFNPRDIAGRNLSDLLSTPDLQINSWPPTSDSDPSLNYAVSYMFCVYLYQRFGVPFIQDAAQSKYKGMAALEHALTDLNENETLDQVFTDWTIANEVNSPYVGDGRYYYQSLKLPKRPTPIDLTPGVTENDTVQEYGAEYLSLPDPGTYQLTFNGQRQVALMPTRSPTGQWMWWSYNQPHGASRLDHAFDLTNATNATLKFQAWWNIYKDYDVAHVLVSSDDGQTWKTVGATDTSRCQLGGSCFTGKSRGWQTETVDLSAYDGQPVRVRIEYITQSTDVGAGLFLTNFRLDAIGFTDDVQHGANEWQTGGFMRITQYVPQYWAVNVITLATGSGTARTIPQVIPMTLDSRNTGTMTVTVPKGGVVIDVAAMAPFVQTGASYTLSAHQTS
ncbi:MAG: hypothetical protein ACYDBJ_13520 [Aggregatilineales bacterium]